MLNIHALNQFYGASHTLREVSFSVEAGRICCLMGRNGVGKTTLLNTLLGLLPAQSGTLSLNGDSIAELATEDRVRQGIGVVPQGRMIFPDLTVGENLETALAARKDGLRQIPDRVFEYFPVLAEMLERRGGDLSGGQQQQLAIGRALVTGPRLLLLDEPCEGIQPNIVELIGNVLQRLRSEEGMTILLVEQKLRFARAVGDEFVIMDRGSVVATGAMDTLTDEIVDEHLTV